MPLTREREQWLGTRFLFVCFFEKERLLDILSLRFQKDIRLSSFSHSPCPCVGCSMVERRRALVRLSKTEYYLFISCMMFNTYSFTEL